MAQIRVRDLNKTFFGDGKRVEVLKDLSLDIEKGEVLNILGASGVGKSTLLYIMGTLDRPTSGKIIHNGVDVFTMGDGDLASFRNEKIGFVFQFHNLLSEFTALENAMMPGLVAGWSAGKTEKRAIDVLGRLGLENRIHHRPGELSGGEQQRVAVARAIFLSPDVVLADEPTGNLDSKIGGEVHDLLMDLNKELKITMIIVTHNLKLAEKRGRRVLLVDGKIENN